MDVLLWIRLLPVLCTALPAAGAQVSTASQHPRILPATTVNSSAEILCSTSRPDPTGLYLRGRFHGDRTVAYLDIKGGVVRRVTVHQDFAGRVEVTGEPGRELALRLSWLGLEDTDSYLCSWEYFDIAHPSLASTLHGHATLIVVRERDPESACSRGLTGYIDLILIVSCVSFFIIILSVFIVMLVRRCKKKRKRQYTPGRAGAHSRDRPRQQRGPGQHPHRCPQHRDQPPNDSHNPQQPYYLT